MSTPAHNDWNALATEWQGLDAGDLTAVTAELGRKVRAHRLRMLGVLATEVLITAVTIGVSIELLRWHRDARAVVTAVWSWVLIVVVWALALWNRRGTWRPVGEHARDYLAISLLRCRRQLRTVRVVLALALVQLVPLLLWTAARATELGGGTPTPRAFLALALAAALIASFVGWAVWFHRRTLAELTWLEAVRGQMDLADQKPG